MCIRDRIYLDIEGEKVDALVKNIDYNPIEKQLMALDFQALVAGEKVSTTVTIKLEHTDMVQGIVEQEMEEVHYKADPATAGYYRHRLRRLPCRCP